MGIPIGYFEIHTSDSGAAGKFYSELFSWQLKDDMYDYLTVDTGSDTGISGGIRKLDEQSSTPGTLMYAIVDDVSAVLKKAQSLGGSTAVEPYDIPGVGTMAVLADPEGSRIGLWKQSF
ncbi:VOC family protein [Blastococcus montanus]|uniref:VOC family protein n=1 Tax=Blastococcus montanus TaxID=3144973 RepID=UPI003209ED14